MTFASVLLISATLFGLGWIFVTFDKKQDLRMMLVTMIVLVLFIATLLVTAEAARLAVTTRN